MSNLKWRAPEAENLGIAAALGVREWVARPNSLTRYWIRLRAWGKYEVWTPGMGGYGRGRAGHTDLDAAKAWAQADWDIRSSNYDE